MIEINVSKLEKSGYRHLFATAPRSIDSTDALERVLPEIRSKFPAPEYKISISVQPETSTYFELESADVDAKIVEEVTYCLYPSMRPKEEDQ